MYCPSCGYGLEVTGKISEKAGMREHEFIHYECQHCGITVKRNLVYDEGAISKDIAEIDWSETNK